MTNKTLISAIEDEIIKLERKLSPENKDLVQNWDALVAKYKNEDYVFKVRDKEIRIKTHTESLSHTPIAKVALPKFKAWGDRLRWQLQENIPGEFPYTAGIYPFKREGEDPTRMFAGEGGPERTNRRFHYVSLGMPAKRLSTAFDSVTLYGNDPHIRPDIYGKIGNSGVSICCLDDAKKLYSGFDLADPKTSVSMTINGPAPMLLGFFMNAAIDQQCEKYIKQNNLVVEVEAKIKAIYAANAEARPSYQGPLPEGNDGLGLMLLGVTGDQVLSAEVYQEIKNYTLSQVRGTVQADILKEDQAQNTCIFSTEFALRLMGDVQQYFINKGVRNFYSVSISGYHIDTLFLKESVKNQIYAADLRVKGTLEDSMLVNILFSGSVVDSIQANSAKLMRIHLPPGSYDTLIYEGDWSGDPMVLESTGKPGAKLEFCATFFF